MFAPSQASPCMHGQSLQRSASLATLGPLLANSSPARTGAEERPRHPAAWASGSGPQAAGLPSSGTVRLEARYAGLGELDVGEAAAADDALGQLGCGLRLDDKGEVDDEALGVGLDQRDHAPVQGEAQTCE